MAHFKRRKTSNKVAARRIDKRHDTKKLRATTRNVLSGGKTKSIQSDKWSVKLDQPPHLEHQTVGKPKPKSASKQKWCKGKKGQLHLPEERSRFSPYTGYAIPYTVCSRCSKPLSYRNEPSWILPQKVHNPHWDIENIQLRLAGLPCPCASCREKEQEHQPDPGEY